MPVAQNSSFIQGTFYQKAWDSTSLGLLKTCPRKYQLTIIDEWRPKNESIHLTFGIIYHAALETYDRVKFETGDLQAASRAAVHRALQDSWINGSPWQSGDSNKNRFNLVRAVIWYLDQFTNDPCETVRLATGAPAVELSFRMELPAISPENNPYMLCGHLDRLVTFSGSYWGMDRKTTKGSLDPKFFAQFSPNNQMSLYSCAGSVILKEPIKGMIVDGVQVAVGFSRFQRGYIHRTKAQLDEWMHDTKELITLAERYAAKGYWPMNDQSCSNYGGCPFREVCSKDPSVRENFLSADFIKQTWDPLQTREV